jgi:hypothetical protein
MKEALKPLTAQESTSHRGFGDNLDRMWVGWHMPSLVALKRCTREMDLLSKFILNNWYVLSLERRDTIDSSSEHAAKGFVADAHGVPP